MSLYNVRADNPAHLQKRSCLWNAAAFSDASPLATPSHMNVTNALAPSFTYQKRSRSFNAARSSDASPLATPPHMSVANASAPSVTHHASSIALNAAAC